MRPVFGVYLTALVIAGCSDPYAADTPAGAQPDTRAARPTVDGDAGARAALSRFCDRWTNWSWRQLAPHQQSLLRLAAPPLRQALRAGVANATDDRPRNDRLRSTGHVLRLELGRADGQMRGRCLVRERHFINGERTDVRRSVYLAELAKTTSGWEISRWEPQL